MRGWGDVSASESDVCESDYFTNIILKWTDRDEYMLPPLPHTFPEAASRKPTMPEADTSTTVEFEATWAREMEPNPVGST